MKLPPHLKKYIVSQESTNYTPIDHASWRFILRQLKSYLSQHAHESYKQGLEITGITIDEIPSIENISKKLQKFGWQAVPVSGFIPPSAFLEMQAHKILPIASDMRSLDHLTYTPAPDIVHEAAGHAPMLANPQFRSYLEEYALVAKKAIISKKDLELYTAIRDLSDIKEHPNATAQEVQICQKKLDTVATNMGEPSEAALLARMGWWTTEYGLIGHDDPHIYGAGLLSSIGESQSALSPKTQKIPMSIDCIKYSYDITEPQPQLFVTPNFELLSQILQNFSEQMSYKKGGVFGLKKAQEAKTVNTVEFETGLQISGILEHIEMKDQNAIYLKFQGPCQLALGEKEIPNHGKLRHQEGFGCPVGKIKSKVTQEKITLIEWDSGIKLQGELISSYQHHGAPLIQTFKNCKVIYQDQILFDPSWGEYDLVLGTQVSSVYGGAADFETYGEFEDFSKKLVPKKEYTGKQKELFQLYQEVRDIRQKRISNSNLENILEKLNQKFPQDWLLKLELYELGLQSHPAPKWLENISSDLKNKARENPQVGPFILEGLKIAKNLFI